MLATAMFSATREPGDQTAELGAVALSQVMTFPTIVEFGTAIPCCPFGSCRELALWIPLPINDPSIPRGSVMPP